MELKTKYTVDTIPFPEHPAPQLMRESWLNLNGKWKLEKLSSDKKVFLSSEILVPFSPETINSGVEKGFALGVDEELVYTRTFKFDFTDNDAVKLHFGAVDSECEVFVNGKAVGSHKGGFTPFTFDVTDVLLGGENQIVVRVKDRAICYGGARGKQLKKRGGIWYTPQSGIYQTVWLERMPKDYVNDIKITPSVSDLSVTVKFNSKSLVTATVFDDGREIIKQSGSDKIVLNYDFELWSPEKPKLYDLVLKNQSGDKIKSYFGVRSFGIVSDKKGKKRLSLNGKPYFYNGVLDQGYWSDGLLTYPSDKAVLDELKMLKDMGFNTVRKHIKLEPMRWYYHCDRLGLAVWQDFVNGGGEYNFMKVAALPFLGFKHKDSDYKYFERQNKEGRDEYINSVKETIDALYNSTCVAVYVPFNEGWGQFDSYEITKLTKELDPTRIIDSVSGWYDQGKDKTTIKSLHTYYTPLKVPKDSRAVVLSEYGGYSLKVDGHTFNPDKTFGYKNFKDTDSYLLAVEKLFLNKLKPLIKKGLSGAIYTQVSDVEDEINGLVTFDRKVQKIPTEKMREINDKLKEEWESIE